jgi:hypothetical protein
MNAKNMNEIEQQFSPQQEAAGWDPYEIWRTRVLLPRLLMAGEFTVVPVEETQPPARDLAA